MRLVVAAPIAALVGALVAGAALLAAPAPKTRTDTVMPAASPSTTAGVPLDGVHGEHPPPPSVPVGAVAAGYGASRSGPGGVPLGFARTSDGAAAAATAWLATVEGSGILDTTRRTAVLGAIGDPDFVAGATARLADRAAALGLSAVGRPATGRVTATVWADRGAYRVVSYGPVAARVEIWHLYQVGVVPPGAQPGPGQWRRAQAAVRWDIAANDWRLSSDLTFVDGPDPQVAVPSRLERAAMLARLGEGQGWLLYANSTY